MEWLVNPNNTYPQGGCIDYSTPCGHKCTDYCGTKQGCPIYVCGDKGCNDYFCIIYYG